MSKEKGKTQNEKRKLTRQEKKQIDALIRQAKGDGKPHTAQDSIPFERMYKDGICRLANGRYSKCIEFEDINYQLAQPDDKTAIFEALCDMYNSFDASISVQLSLISRHANKDDFKNSITIAPQNDDFDSIRAEYTEMLRTQLERGNNGLIKTKFLTFTVEAKDIRSARARLARIETDTLNHFKVIGAAARVLDGKQRLEVLHGIFHPDGERFNFAWEWLPASGLSVKDFIAPSSFRFGDGRMFQMGGKFGAVSFLQIVAPELSDRMLADFMDAENGIIVNLHIQSIDHNEAIIYLPARNTESDPFRVIVQGDSFMGITTHSKNPEAAKAFVEWFYSDAWYPGYINFVTSASSMTNFPKEKDPILAEADAAQPDMELVMYDGGGDDFQAIQNETAFDYKKLGAEMFTKGFDLTARLEELNTKWAAARQKLGIQ